MKDILEKISSYNIFNHLLPGILFVIILSKTTSYNLIQDNFVLGLFLYYFIGLVISRLGSLLIEPFLKWTKFVKFSKYEQFLAASKKDEKIELMSEVNNMYRTFLSMFVGLLMTFVYDIFLKNISIFKQNLRIILLIGLLILFLFSYRKQIQYISKRIEANKNNKP